MRDLLCEGNLSDKIKTQNKSSPTSKLIQASIMSKLIETFYYEIHSASCLTSSLLVKNDYLLQWGWVGGGGTLENFSL